jgi:putative ABC transport system substrate-binding protein
MRRRDFCGVLGGSVAAAWPLYARAQQQAMPVIGFLSASSPVNRAYLVNAFRRGIQASGYVESQNVAIDYRWADDQYDRLANLGAELIRRRVAVIVATDTPAAMAIKAANTTIPIVFVSGSDPVKDGLVASFNRPGGNVTGIIFMVSVLGAKQFGLLHELLPRAVHIAVLADPKWPITEPFVSDVRAAALAIGKSIDVLHASTGRDLDAVFSSLAQKPDALVVGPSALTNNRRVQVVTLAAYHRVPAIYSFRESVEAGGLMSYGANITDAYYQAGTYTSRILKGDKPGDLPVMQSTKFEFVINLNTARAFGLTIPQSFLSRADEVIQ